MNYSNYYQFYNEFLYQHHKSLLNRVQKCEIEENQENIQHNSQVQIDDTIDMASRLTSKPEENEDRTKGISSNIISTATKRDYSSTSESDINEMNLRQKFVKNLRRKRRKQSLIKIQNSLEYETSSTSSAFSENESILNSLKSSEDIRLRNYDISDKKLADKEEQIDANCKGAELGNIKIAPKIVSKENKFNQLKSLKPKLPENLKSFDKDDQNLRKPEFLKSLTSKNILIPKNNILNHPLPHNFHIFPTQSFEQSQFNSQHLMLHNQYQISQFSHFNYLKFYEAQQNFSFHSHKFEGEKEFAVRNEIYRSRNGQNIDEMYHNFNESHNVPNEFHANHTKPFSNPTETHQESTQAHHLFPIPNFYCNKPFIQPLSIPIQSPSTANIFKCDNCPKIFKSIVRLKNHIEKHHSRKLAYKCKYCRSSFKRKSKLLNHQHKFHSEEFSSRKKSSVFHNVELLAQSDCHRN